MELEIQKDEWDLIFKKMTEFQLNDIEKHDIKNEILHKEGMQKRRLKNKITVYDYEPKAIIGRGAFGEVRICKSIKTGKIVALKKLFKEEMHKKNQIIHVRTEKDFLKSASHPFIVDLTSSFQDSKHLYLEMDFMIGGDLMSQLIKKEIFTEYEAKFYTAQIISAVEYIHGKNCIHRDIKPDNVLIDKQGYTKLSDFGLSKVLDKNIYKTFFNDNSGTNNINDNSSSGNTKDLYYNEDLMKNRSNAKSLNTLSKLRKKRIVSFFKLFLKF